MKGPLANRYCGNGNADRCRTALWAAMEAAGAELAATQGARPERVARGRHPGAHLVRPGLLPYTMRYTNRPSGIQQVIEFSGHRPTASQRRRPAVTG